MTRRLSAEERALWRKVVATVRPLEPGAAAAPEPGPDPPSQPTPARAATPRRVAAPAPAARPGTTLDSTWDRRLARGLVAPDSVVDLHGHDLATAYELIDRALDRSIAAGDRLLLLVTGKPPAAQARPGGRGAIRAAVGDWLAASSRAGHIAAVRNAAPRHGGAGALYIVLRRRREPS